MITLDENKNWAPQVKELILTELKKPGNVINLYCKGLERTDSIRAVALAQVKTFREHGNPTFYLTSAMSKVGDLELSNPEATFELILIRINGSVNNIRRSARYALFKVYQALRKRTRPASQMESEFTLLGIQTLVEKAVFPMGGKADGT